jgi:hypothetical protein
MTQKKSLLFKQIIIILWLLAAAISSVEATNQFKIGGFTNWKFYFFLAIFITSVVMYFIRKKQRLEQK